MMEYFKDNRGTITGAKEILFTHGMGIVRVMDQRHADWQIIYEGEVDVAETIYETYRPEGEDDMDKGWVEKFRNALKEPQDMVSHQDDCHVVLYRNDVEAGRVMAERHILSSEFTSINDVN